MIKWRHMLEKIYVMFISPEKKKWRELTNGWCKGCMQQKEGGPDQRVPSKKLWVFNKKIETDLRTPK